MATCCIGCKFISLLLQRLLELDTSIAAFLIEAVGVVTLAGQAVASLYQLVTSQLMLLIELQTNTVNIENSLDGEGERLKAQWAILPNVVTTIMTSYPSTLPDVHLLPSSGCCLSTS